MNPIDDWKIVLRKINDRYPAKIEYHDDLIDDDDGLTEEDILRCLGELVEYGYITALFDETVAGESYGDIKITRRGIDSLLADGGETARQNTVIVSFQRDEIITLFEACLKEAKTPQKQRQRLLEELQSMPSALLKEAIMGGLKLLLGEALGAPLAIKKFLDFLDSLLKK